MRAAISGLLTALLAASLCVPALAQESQSGPESVDSVLAAVVPYAPAADGMPGDIASLTTYREELIKTRGTYQAWRRVLAPRLAELNERVGELTAQVAALEQQVVDLEARLDVARAQLQAQERKVGALARLLYQQPSPDMTALAQLIDGEDLRAFDRQDLVTQVLQSQMAELERIRAEVDSLTDALAQTRSDLDSAGEQLEAITADRDRLATKLAVVQGSLAAIGNDLSRAQAKVDAIRAAERARIAAAAAAAKAAEAKAAAIQRTAAAARPTGGGSPARVSGSFSARLPDGIPYRSVFLTYGLRYNVEPALLAAIAAQESNFNAWAGCDRAGAGKGIMQHESQDAYCGPDAVPASVEKAAIMLAKYYNSSGSWTAAVFAYNNGPGLMDEWVRYSGNRDQLLSVLAAYYDKQPYATPGAKAGYGSWGQWRARVAYSYAAADPLPGFRSATQTWLIYRQG